ncbi:MAG TPA: hypothetical protein VJZ04_01080 [Lachnospiraceae bacterium]|nr:hypothetical protein [Lachnospiraceae bacterium]
MKTLLKNFITCGIVGWIMEISFTAMDSLKKRDLSLKGTTSIWMFPIYGMASILTYLYYPLKTKCIAFRGTIYMLCIFFAEFFTGKLLCKHHLCPWDYSRSRWNISKVIRLDYIPYWFAAGLIFERIVCHRKSAK